MQKPCLNHFLLSWNNPQKEVLAGSHKIKTKGVKSFETVPVIEGRTNFIASMIQKTKCLKVSKSWNDLFHPPALRGKFVALTAMDVIFQNWFQQVGDMDPTFLAPKVPFGVSWFTRFYASKPFPVEPALWRSVKGEKTREWHRWKPVAHCEGHNCHLK